MTTELKDFAKQLNEFGGTVYQVGGSLRDERLGVEADSKDLDLEVFGVTANFLRDFLKTRFKVSEVGASFGVFKVRMDELDVDVSLPRRDSKVGTGHKGFEVEVDPDMTVKEACQRRDFTCNAMMRNVLTGEVVDPFFGEQHIHSGYLKMVDEDTFDDDPLRVLRAVQFAGRFQFEVEQATFDKMSSMVFCDQLSELPGERLFEEFKKLFLKSEYPSFGLSLAFELGLFFKVFPEFAKMADTPQEPEWHPEGLMVRKIA